MESKCFGYRGNRRNCYSVYDHRNRIEWWGTNFSHYYRPRINRNGRRFARANGNTKYNGRTYTGFNGAMEYGFVIKQYPSYRRVEA